MQVGKRSAVEDRLHPTVVARIRQEIEESEGQEVLFIGELNPEGRVVSIRTVAHGNRGAVPALYPYMEKGEVVIHNHPGRRLSPSAADIQVASKLGNEGIGFYIVDNRVERLYVVAEPVRVADRTEIDIEKLRNLLLPQGALSKSIPFYEPRSVQIEMLEVVARAFNEGGLDLVEAGTGVGKSLAYLLPAIEWVANNEERVVVSTATINLQEQLVEKDIPLVLYLLERKVPIALVKGRGNYFCWTRLAEAQEEASLFEEEQSSWKVLKDWATSSPTGARGDLPFPIEDSVWSQVCSESDICTGLRCLNRELCFFLKSRKRAAGAKLLVVNHHLLFSDLAFRMQGYGFESTAVLPPFQRIIFDEAHNLENSATSLFSESLNRFYVFRALNRLLRTKGVRKLGLAVKLSNLGASGSLIVRMSEEIQRVRERYISLEEEAAPEIGEGGNLRITAPVGFAKTFVSFQQASLDLAETLKEILHSLSEEDAESPEAHEGRMILHRLESMSSLCEQFSSPSENKDRVLWIERKRTREGETFLEFHSTPLDITHLMREAVYEPFETVVFTSATLTVNRVFTFWKNRMGLSERQKRACREFILDSPFDYKSRVLIGVPTDAPAPDSDQYIEFLSKLIGEACERTQGRALILFTSNEMLARVYKLVKPTLQQMNIVTYRQGEEERSRLLRKFNENISSVLFATDSFWEGIDAPGETLQMVILCRLPFKVPTDPVQLARMEAIQQKGKNPFLELSLPEAIMKLRQGFGRLMRRTSDRGIVLIPDVRLIKKSYGNLFLSSLPTTRRSMKELKDLLVSVEDFLAHLNSQEQIKKAAPLP